MILGMGLYYGGIAQITPGILEFNKGNTFAAIAFISYGLFWHVRPSPRWFDGHSMRIEGLFARAMYGSLHKMHQHALRGASKVVLDTAAGVIVRRTASRIKLY